MFDWISIALTALKVVNAIVGMVRQKQDMDAGRDKAIAEEAMAILRKTEAGKKIMERIDAMSDGELDDLTDAIGGAG